MDAGGVALKGYVGVRRRGPGLCADVEARILAIAVEVAVGDDFIGDRLEPLDSGLG